MPVYEYRAFDQAGKSTSGIIDADNAVGARQKLRGSGIFPVDVKETSSRHKTAVSSQPTIRTLFQRVKSGELSVMTRQLSILLNAGVTLVTSLDTLISQMSNPVLKKIMAQVKESVNEGNSLAFALTQHPKIFSQIYVNMVRAGEASGSLDLVLERLADFSERQETLKSRFKAALAYPVFMFFIGSIILIGLVTFVVPQISGIFDNLDRALPLPTILLINLSDFMKSFWWLILIILAGMIILLKKLKSTDRGAHFWDKMKLTAPVFGDINVKIAMARLGRTLGSLLQNGVPLMTALKIVRNIVNNSLIAETIDRAMDQIEAGKSLAMPFSTSPWFPPIAVQMISVGEQSGELEAMLNKIADIYERETEAQIMAMTSMLEPVMILVMGVSVGFIVFAILLPIFEMNQLVR